MVTYSNFTIYNFERCSSQILLRSPLLGSWWQRVEPMMPWPWKIAGEKLRKKITVEIGDSWRQPKFSHDFLYFLVLCRKIDFAEGLSSFQSWTMWIPLHAGCISWAYKALETWCMKKDGWESVQVSTVPHESNESAVSAKFPTSAAFKNCFRSSKAGEDLEALPPKGCFRSNGFKWR